MLLLILKIYYHNNYAAIIHYDNDYHNDYAVILIISPYK